jgi:hypothetical protein
LAQDSFLATLGVDEPLRGATEAAETEDIFLEEPAGKTLLRRLAMSDCSCLSAFHAKTTPKASGGSEVEAAMAASSVLGGVFAKG